MRFTLILFAAVCLGFAQNDPTEKLFSVTAAVETDPVPSAGDAADDIAIWVHPTDPAKSAIVSTNKSHDGKGGLYLYGLDGKLVSSVVGSPLNNVDGRYGFTLGGKKVDIFAATNRGDETLDLFVINPKTRALTLAGSIDLSDQAKLTGFHDPYGVSFYLDAKNDDFHVFVSDRIGHVAQFRLREEKGKITGEMLRHWKEAGTVEGMVADDLSGHIFIGAEAGGVFRYKAVVERNGDAPPAKPGPPPKDRVVVDTTQGHLTTDVEGLAIYDIDGGGYLLVSSQGSNRFVIYDRKSLAYIATFTIDPGKKGIDGVSDTDGIEVISGSLGPAFPLGVFIAQDGYNDPQRQNFKVVNWEHIIDAAKAQKIDLKGERKFDPRKPRK